MQRQRRDDGLCHLVLKRENVGLRALIAFGPLMAAGRGIDELDIDAHLVASTPYTSFQDIPDAELASDLAQVD